jgi:hypothetical protein
MLKYIALFIVLCASLSFALLPPEELQAIEDMKVAIPSLAYTWGNSDVCTGNSGTLTCSGGHVTIIEMGNDQLTGYLPDSIGNFSMLNTLKLYYNDLQGPIPSTIGNLANLQVLELGKNQFSGGIPESIGNLKKLTRLVLSYIGLTGSIPSSIGNMSSLQTIMFMGNSLTGSIPESIGMLSALTDFGAADNQLEGTLPESIGNLTSLKYLTLNNNKINGTVPNTIEGMTSLTQINLQNNLLSGTVPSAFGRLPLLRLLAMDSNKFTGCLSLETIPDMSVGFSNNFLCCSDNRYAPVPYIQYPCQANGRLQILINEVISPSATYYTSLSVHADGVIDLTNQTELITVECLTINGTIRFNMSSVNTSMSLDGVDLFKFTCSSTNISAVAMDIITSSECQSSYQLREKIVGRVRTVNADIDIQCNTPNSPDMSSNTPSETNSPSSSSTPSSNAPSASSPNSPSTSGASYRFMYSTSLLLVILFFA